ncbi:MAG: Gmad2 immunoglobulin-like domain-containing protein [Actinobacteria bacterium]|nr:Gmad2 immunoglobulin-like domain-containing protein [Actinomycetota bacterium]
MKDDRLIERLREMDPATPERLAAASRDTDEMRRGILACEVDELAIRRRVRRHRIGVTAAAALVTAALLVPLILLLPLGDDEDPNVGATPSTPPPTATSEPSDPPVDPGTLGPIEVTEPAPGATVTSPVTISGTADVFEATVSIRIVDGVNNVIAETFATATCGTGCRGDYSIEVPYSVNTEQRGLIEVFEISAEDGSRINSVRVPVTLTPGPEDPVAAAVEGDWTAPDGTVAPNGLSGAPLVLHTFEGAEHCGWTSVTFMSMGWPIGTEVASEGDAFRLYIRDPQGVLGTTTSGVFRAHATLPEDAVDTGYHRGDWQLWIAPSDADQAVYVVNADPAARGVVERWQHSTQFPGCD